MSVKTKRDIAVETTEDPIDTRGILDEIDPGCGALVTFSGVVRNHNEGRDVQGITYQSYRQMVPREGTRIAEEICERFAVQSIRLVHRVGELKVGDTAMFVAVAAPHRREAFAGIEALIDLVKERLPIWKKERYADDTAEWL